MKKKFFIQRFFRNFLLLIIPILTIGCWAIIRYNHMITENTKQNNWNILHRVEETMSTLHRLSQNSSLYFEKNPSVVISLKNALRDDVFNYSAINATNAMALYLQNVVNNNKYIYSAYVYYDNQNGRFLTSDSGLTNTSRYYHTEWIDHYKNSDKKEWCELTEIKRYQFSSPTKLLSVYSKISSPAAAPSYDGVFVMQFDLEKIRDYLTTLSLYSGQTISILDDETHVLLQTAPMDISSIWDHISKKPPDRQASIALPIQYDNVDYIASIVSSTENDGWSYLSLVPSKILYRESINLLRMISLLTILALAFSLFISMLFANKDYKNLASILDILNHAGKESYEPPPLPNRSLDTYGFIMQNLVEMFVRQKYLQVQISERKYKTQVLEMQVLQQQINPHFLFNTLHTIYWEALSMTKRPNSCTQMISSLSDIMEYALGNPQEKVMLQQEINYVKSYLDIQKVRYKEKFDVIWDVDGEAVIYPTIKMLLQPIVENSIYHGIKEREGSGLIKIRIFRRDGQIVLDVADSGIGMSRETLQLVRAQLTVEAEYVKEDMQEELSGSASHIGLRNTNRRLLLAFGSDYGITIKSKRDMGTVVSIRIPIILTNGSVRADLSPPG